MVPTVAITSSADGAGRVDALIVVGKPTVGGVGGGRTGGFAFGAASHPAIRPAARQMVLRRPFDTFGWVGIRQSTMEAWANQVKRSVGRVAGRVVVGVGVVIGLLLTAPARAEPRVLIVSIDGLRPDVALRAEMPTLRKMMRLGSFTFWATTTPAAITLPSHTSMLTGVTIERHGIKGNDDDSAAAEPIRVPTIFDLAKAAGVSTGMASGKSKFSMYANSIDHAWQPEPTPTAERQDDGRMKRVLKGTSVRDDVTADHAVEIIATHRPRLMLLHLARNDGVGHGRGWGSAEQIEGLAVTDKQLGRVVEALRSAGVLAETTIILSADHGGLGRSHGKDNDPSKFIPWIIVGPGIRPNVDLSQYKDRPIRTYDTFATACRVLGLTPAADIDGSPVLQAFEGTELLNKGPATEPAKVPATLPKEPY